MSVPTGIDPSVPPSGPGCAACDTDGGWRFRLAPGPAGRVAADWQRRLR